MWVKTLRITNVKSFENSGEISFGKGINLLVAPNNAGKTCILRCLYSLQNSDQNTNFPFENRRVPGKNPEFDFTLAEISEKIAQEFFQKYKQIPGFGNLELIRGLDVIVQFRNQQGSMHAKTASPAAAPFERFLKTEPDCWIYPFLSRRKQCELVNTVGATFSKIVDEVMPHLDSKLDRVIADHAFQVTCEQILGIPIGQIQFDSGKTGGFPWDETGASIIPVSKMGEGTRNVLLLLVELWRAKNRLFLLEEPENDIHPRALKRLLQVVADKASSNQFVISTHSNIVVKELGKLPTTKIFRLSLQIKGGVPTSAIQEVENNPQARLAALEDLGYEMLDFDLHKGFLFLEESSAERIIESFLIPEFVPGLQGILRTVSCNGVTKVKKRFEVFQSFFLFVHLTPIYENRGWVAVDGNADGKMLIEELQEAFPRAEKQHFRTFRELDFERYYPEVFRSESDRILNIRDEQKKRDEKKSLLHRVLGWIEQNRANGVARQEFEKSAKEIIEILKEIHVSLK